MYPSFSPKNPVKQFFDSRKYRVFEAKDLRILFFKKNNFQSEVYFGDTITIEKLLISKILTGFFDEKW